MTKTKHATLIFIYNAKSGFLNSMLDSAHKVLSPKTYNCQLCAVTHGAFGMHPEWKEFLDTLNINLQFFHKDELETLNIPEIALPAIYCGVAGEYKELLSADELNTFKDLQKLKEAIVLNLQRKFPDPQYF